MRRRTPKSDARTRAHSESFAKQLMLSAEALHHFTQPIVRERFYAMIVAASHGVVVGRGVNACSFRSQHNAREERGPQVTRHCLEAMCGGVGSHDGRMRTGTWREQRA